MTNVSLSEFVEDFLPLCEKLLKELAIDNHEEAAKKLVNDLIATFAGTSVYIPHLTYEKKKARCDSIIADYENGLSKKEAAKKYGVSLQYVYKILSK